MKRMNIAVALNSKYMRYTYVMLTSLFVNNADTEIRVFVLHNDLTDSDRKKLQGLAKRCGNEMVFLHIDKADFPKELPTTEAWTIETYFRLLLLDVLPQEIDRLLYIDVDMIVNKPLEELYATDFEGKNFCVCPDMTMVFPFPQLHTEMFAEQIRNGFTYFNAGLMLWNVTKLRREGYCFARYMELAKQLQYKLLAPDQDLLNYMHWDQVKYLDEYQYDLFSRLAYNKDVHYEEVKNATAIIHYAGMKPWEGEYIHYDIEQLWWDYAKKTPFYYELMEEFLWANLNKPVVYDMVTAMSEEKRQMKAELDKSVEVCRKLMQLLERK